MFSRFMSFFRGSVSKAGENVKKAGKRKREKKTEHQSPFGDMFKDVKTQTFHKKMEMDEALQILNFNKDDIPTIEEIDEK